MEAQVDRPARPRRQRSLLGGPQGLEGVVDAAFASDPRTGRIVQWNAAASELLGLTPEQVLGSPCATLLRGVDTAGHAVCADPCPYLSGRRSHPDMFAPTALGERYLTVLTLDCLVGGRPAVVHLLRPVPAADLDALTGCLTRVAFLARARAEQRRAGRSGAALTLLLCDLDGLKRVNDTGGHQAGDRLLAAAGGVLSLGRPSDAVGRWGGDEFAVLLPETTAEHARRRQVRALTLLRRAPGAAAEWTFSSGITDLRPDEEVDAALRRADRALYLAKGRGPGRVAVLRAPGAARA